jgi:SSS family transporter
MHLHPADLVIIAGYFAALSAIGLWCSRGQRTRADYHLGGGRIHWLLAGGSVLVTLISTLSFLAAPGEMVRYGVAYFAGALALPLCAPVINRVLIPLLRSFPGASIYEHLETRFNSGVRRLAAVVFVVRTVLWIGLIVYSCTLAIGEVTGAGRFETLLVTGLITTFYAAIGGFKGVVWTDNVQLVILFGGAISVPLYAAATLGSGPLEWWALFSQAGRAHIEVFSFDPTVRITLVGMLAMTFFWTLCSNASDQAAAQRYLSTPDVATARRSVWVFALLNMGLTLLLMLCGLALFAFYAGRSELPVEDFQRQIAARADQLMPMFIARELPPGLSGLMLAALFAAAMSSISSGVNSVSSVVVTDLWKPSNAGSLLLDKSIAAGAGLLGISAAALMAWWARQDGWNLYELTGRVNNLLVGPMAVLFLSGILLRRATARGALAGFAAASAVAIWIIFCGLLVRGSAPISFTWLVPVSFLGGMACSALLSQVGGRSRAVEERA